MATSLRLGPATSSRLLALASLPGPAGRQRCGRTGQGAKLSEDLKRKIQAGDASATSVILSGSQATCDELAARHGLRVSRRLNGGAVVDVPAGALAALSQDGDVDQLSSNSVVRSMMAVTNETIGSALLHTSDLDGPRALTGKGIGVAVIDSGVANLPEIGKAWWPAWTSPAPTPGTSSGTARTWPASSPLEA